MTGTEMRALLALAGSTVVARQPLAALTTPLVLVHPRGANSTRSSDEGFGVTENRFTPFHTFETVLHVKSATETSEEYVDPPCVG